MPCTTVCTLRMVDAKSVVEITLASQQSNYMFLRYNNNVSGLVKDIGDQNIYNAGPQSKIETNHLRQKKTRCCDRQNNDEVDAFASS